MQNNLGALGNYASSKENISDTKKKPIENHSVDRELSNAQRTLNLL